jgi:cardiolipin synthase
MGHYQEALWGVVAAGITDLADGFLARTLKQNSILGTWLDPLADKILTNSLTVSLAVGDLVPWWLCGVILLRDIGLMGGAFLYRYQSVPAPRTWRSLIDVRHQSTLTEVHPTFMGKLSTALQLSMITLSLAAPIYGFHHHPLLECFYYIVGGTTIISGSQYLCNKKEIFKNVTVKK